MVNRVSVSIGGIELQSGFNDYNVFKHAKAVFCGHDGDPANSHPDIVRSVSYVDMKGNAGASLLTGVQPESYLDTFNQTQFCIDNWEGFLGSLEPRLFDSSLVGDIVISIYLADNAVLTTSKDVGLIPGSLNLDNFPAVVAPTGTFGEAGTGANYTLSNIHATITCCGMADSVYDNMISAMIAERGFIECPFKNYVSFNDTHSGSTRFSVATQSLDRLWAAFRTPVFASQSAPTIVAGYKRKGGVVSGVGTVDTATGAFNNPHDAGLEMLPYFGFQEKYNARFYRFSVPRASNADDSAILDNTTYQWQLNGAPIPNFQATPDEWYTLSKQSAPGYYKNTDMPLVTYKYDYFVLCQRLNLPDSEYSRTLSGLDTRAVAISGYLNTTGVTTNPNVVIWAEMSSTIRIGAAKMIEVIQ